MASALHPIERKLLVALSSAGSLDFESLVGRAGLNVDQARRAIQWLSSKGMVVVQDSVESRLEVVRRPPELELMGIVEASTTPLTLEALRKRFESPAEFSAAIGRARGSGWVAIGGSPAVVTKKSSQGAEELESLLGLVGSTAKAALPPGTEPQLSDLEKRGIIKREDKQTTTITITEQGRGVAQASGSSDEIDRLTPDLISSGAWHGKTLRPIDVEAKAPKFYPGRRHPVRDFIREVREVYISMGFTELEGDSVHPAFWNFDALFIPQDHPGREMQDTFYLAGLQDQSMTRKGLVANVAAVHENGWKTGSKGWGYHWRVEEARRLVLRTHNTVLTVKALAQSKEAETRVFAVSKVYRNENLDYKHLAEFYQMDGIMVGRKLNVRHLMGFLTEFYKKLGMADVKIWPTYFPYTEPSLQVMGYSKSFKSWIELGGSGVFRPEVTVPLGVKVPVLAWGPGIERLMMMRYGLEDMRTLYGADIEWLRGRRELASS